MAIAYARPQIIGRKAGRSAVACAAYRSGEKLHDERYGKIQDYEARSGVLAQGILTPANAPDWMRDREKLWNAVERREDRGTRPEQAQLAREMVIALPHELDDQHREFLLKNILKEAATRKGMIADWAIHAPDAEGDNRNYHAHIMLTMRRIDGNDPDGFGNKAREWNTKQELMDFGAIYERETNRMLERCGFAERVQFKIDDREAQKHMGHAATELERQGQETNIGNANREITKRNQDRADLKKLEAELRAAQAEIAGELQRQHEAALADVRREREAKAAAEEKEKANNQSAAPQDSMTAKLDAWQKTQREEKENAAAQVRATWGGSSGDGLAFMVNLSAHGLSMAKNEWGSYVLVSEKGRVHGLNVAQYGPDAKAIKQAIDAAQAAHAALEIPGVEELRRDQAQRREAEKKEREERRQQEKQERSYQNSLDLTPTQATIRQSFGATMSGQSFAAALEDNGFILAKASKGDVETAQVLAGLNSHIKDAPDWQTRATIKEGDYLVIDERGHAHRLTERTTGADPSAIPGKLANLAATPLPDVQEGKEIMRDVQKQTATEKRMERERQRQHKSNQRAAIRYAVPAPHPSWQAQPWSKTQQVDLTPRPMHPDAHADRMKQQQAERHRQSEDERETRKHNPAMLKDAAQETTERPQDSADGQGQKTAQQERKEKLLKLALANIEARGLDRGGGRTRDR